MVKNGLWNPQINSLLSRVRHTNTLVTAGRGFQSEIETVDILLVDDVPTVLQVRRKPRKAANSLWKRMVMSSSKSQLR